MAKMRSPVRRFSRASLPIALSSLGLALLHGCSEHTPEPWHMPGLSHVAAEPATPDSTWVAVPIREYGSLDGELSFARPNAIATLPDGALVVSDVFTCTLSIIERPGGTLRERWGGCGDGPGEFRFVRAMAAEGDSIFVYDQMRSEIVVLSISGAENRRMAIVPFDEARIPFTLSQIDVMDDSTLVVATEAPGFGSVALIDRGTGEFLRTLIGPPPMATWSDEWIRRVGGVCVQPKGGHRGSTVLVANSWALEGVSLDPYNGAEGFHFLTDLGLPPRQRSDGVWVPGPWRVSLHCGQSLILSRVATLDPADREGNLNTVRAAVIILEARDYDGTLLMRQFVEDRNSLLRATPRAFRGDTLFVVSEQIRPYPIVGEIVLRPASNHQNGSKSQ